MPHCPPTPECQLTLPCRVRPGSLFPAPGRSKEPGLTSQVRLDDDAARQACRRVVRDGFGSAQPRGDLLHPHIGRWALSLLIVPGENDARERVRPVHQSPVSTFRRFDPSSAAPLPCTALTLPHRRESGWRLELAFPHLGSARGVARGDGMACPFWLQRPILHGTRDGFYTAREVSDRFAHAISNLPSWRGNLGKINRTRLSHLRRMQQVSTAIQPNSTRLSLNYNGPARQRRWMHAKAAPSSVTSPSQSCDLGRDLV